MELAVRPCYIMAVFYVIVAVIKIHFLSLGKKRRKKKTQTCMKWKRVEIKSGY